MNTETQATSHPADDITFERYFLDAICDEQTGLRVDVRIPSDPQEALARGSANHLTFYDVFARLMKHKTMSALLAATEGIPVPPDADASFFPVVWPGAVDDELAQDIEEARHYATIRSVGTAEHLFDGEDMQNILLDVIESPPENWYYFWTAFVAEQFGIDPDLVPDDSALNNLRALGEVLRQRNAPPLVFVVYAPELVFTEIENPVEREALITLLNISDWVNALHLHERQHSILFASADWINTRNEECGAP